MIDPSLDRDQDGFDSGPVKYPWESPDEFLERTFPNIMDVGNVETFDIGKRYPSVQ